MSTTHLRPINLPMPGWFPPMPGWFHDGSGNNATGAGSWHWQHQCCDSNGDGGADNEAPSRSVKLASHIIPLTSTPVEHLMMLVAGDPLESRSQWHFISCAPCAGGMAVRSRTLCRCPTLISAHLPLRSSLRTLTCACVGVCVCWGDSPDGGPDGADDLRGPDVAGAGITEGRQAGRQAQCPEGEAWNRTCNAGR